uniref:Oxidized purine nucleoside triphosphate hydrolase n=1 Tax=Strigamia maritima TaxID=126957 RepID=T1J6Y5_STRMM
MRKLMTLAVIRDSSRILLGWKKRGFGSGRWNGFGGKVQPGESIETAAKRELEEECSLKTDSLKRVGIIDFEFEKDPDVMQVHIFTTTQFEGEPTETEEMKPQWFDIDQIPFDQMWPDDVYWYPILLQGKYFRGWMKFRGVTDLLDWKLSILSDESSLNTQ